MYARDVWHEMSEGEIRSSRSMLCIQIFHVLNVIINLLLGKKKKKNILKRPVNGLCVILTSGSFIVAYQMVHERMREREREREREHNN